MNVDLLIIDLDGTLVDSQHDIARAVNETLAVFEHEPLPLSTIAQYVGTGVRGLLDRLLVFGRGIESKIVIDAFRECYGARLTQETVLYPGVLETLAHFAHKKKVVLTNKEDCFVAPILEGLGLAPHFVAHYGRDAFSDRKPSGLPIKRIGEIHGVSPSKALMIGDTPVDIMAGRAAGSYTCGLLFGYGSAKDLRSTNPDLLLSSWSELKDVIT